jgi:hypothetical protein
MHWIKYCVDSLHREELHQVLSWWVMWLDVMLEACRCLEVAFLQLGDEYLGVFACQDSPYDSVEYLSTLVVGPLTMEDQSEDPYGEKEDPLVDGCLDRFRNLVEGASILASILLCVEDVAWDSLIDEGSHQAAGAVAAVVVVAAAVVAVAPGEIAVDLVVVRCSCLEYDSAWLQGCFEAEVASPLEGILGVVDIEDDRREDHLVVLHGYASAGIDQDYWEDPEVLVDCHSLDIELEANNFLVNTEIEVDMGPFYKLHVVACEVKVDQDSLACLAAVHCSVAQDLSFAPPLDPD